MTTLPTFRLFDFEILNRDDPEAEEKQDNKQFMIKMFGMDQMGKTYGIYLKNFSPFFYVKIDNNWKMPQVLSFKCWLQEMVGRRYENSILKCEIVKKRKLYGFDNFTKHKFIKIEFKNMTVFNKVKNLWYKDHKNFKKRRLQKKGLYFEQTDSYLKLYEAKLPPLLRYFHILDISPSGWVTFKKKVNRKKHIQRNTKCNYEYETTWDNIEPLLEKEDGIPLKVMSFDIEASSSHGDFPVAKKSYRKLVGEIIQYWTKNKKSILKMDMGKKNTLLTNLILAGFRFKKIDGISKVYLKNKQKKPSQEQVVKFVEQIITHNLGELLERRELDASNYIERRKLEEMDDEELAAYKDWDLYIPAEFKKNNIIYCLNAKFDAGKKLDILDKAIEYSNEKKIPGYLPKLEGDKCTFIGSTFMYLNEPICCEKGCSCKAKWRCQIKKDKYKVYCDEHKKGNILGKIEKSEPYYNNMIVLDQCAKTPEVPNSEIIWKKKEKNVLLEWTKLIEREDPDVIIGYNIFGFDWDFLIDRSEELRCKDEFLKLGRNKNEKCEIIKSTTTVASGTYNLRYVKIPGRIQIDLYNYFRKNENLPSYKLDYVSSYFIGDTVKDFEIVENKTIIKSNNLMGLKNGHFICFEILGHSSDKYKEGKKFKISNLEAKSFTINHKIEISKKVKFRWCLAKDDVTPQDIFRLSNEGPSSKAIVAKYCFQDCNLVHNLFIKNDIFTAMVEQANICSVPIEYVAMRGQGIKLLSFIAKECSKLGMLMPVMEKSFSKDSYEGAIVLDPKVGLYTDNPVAVNDYSSLYPSCMISENISHDSKVWTKEYDLEGNLIKMTGVKNKDGSFKYDNLEGFKYVDVDYDLYEYRRPTPKAAEKKMLRGRKTCRYVQFKNNEKGVMPSVLKELLASRKATRKLIKYKTIRCKDETEYSGLLKETESTYKVLGKDGEKIFNKEDIIEIKDTYNDFMKNVFDKRQLSKKIVANSLYGQSGAKTSAFYDPDIAASTTATGRKLLIYAKRIVEECYDNKIVETKNHGKVRTKSEYIYGDTDSVFFTFNLEELDGTKIIGKKALEITIELAIQAGELATMFLKAPHDLEYEKTFDPFLLLSKKRYVGMLYETNPNKCKMKSMGIVLKRRDNAACVKDCYGRVVDMLMSGETPQNAAKFVKSYVKDMVDEKIGMDKLIITKSLNGFYKNPDGIAHKVLADRIAKRDPGNKPSVGSRVPFVYIQVKGNVKLQGDKVEDPKFIIENNLKPDYSFYITNQIMKPVTQIFSLLLEKLDGFCNTSMKTNYKRKVNGLKLKYKDDKKKCNEKVICLRDKYIKELIFDDSLRVSENSKKGQKTISSFFKKR